MTKKTSVETAKVSQATKTNIPSGKVVTMAEKEAKRKAREEQYKNFRIAALKRRCTRLKMSEEETKKCIDKLIEQLNTLNNYNILLLFAPKYYNLIKEAFNNNKIVCKMLTETYAWIDGDSKLLAKIREIVPEKTKIHPYVAKKPSVIPKEKGKKSTNNTSEIKKKAKLKRKEKNKLHAKRRKKGRGKQYAKRAKIMRLAKKETAKKSYKAAA